MNALLVYPRFPITYWGFQSGLRLIGKGASLPPLGLITVAARLPSHWRIRLVDLNLGALGEGRLRQCSNGDPFSRPNSRPMMDGKRSRQPSPSGWKQHLRWTKRPCCVATKTSWHGSTRPGPTTTGALLFFILGEE